MSTMMDMLGGTLLCAMVAVIILQLNTSFVTANYNGSIATSMQETLSGIDTTTAKTTAGFIQSMEYYFGRMGYNIDSMAVITTADTGTISFKGDFYNQDLVRSVTFNTLPGSSYTNGGNTKISKWVCLYEGAAVTTSGRVPVSQFRLTYFDSLGKALTPTPLSAANAAKVRSIQVKMQLQSKLRMSIAKEGTRAFEGKITVDTAYASVYWEKIFSPRNLRVNK